MNYIKITLRNIIRHKGYSLINIIGLAVGMAVCILILLWVQDELSYDTFHENSANIYRIASSGAYFNWIDGTPAPLGPAVSAEIPEIIHAVRISEVPRMLFSSGNKVFYEDGFIFVDSSFFEVFSFPFLIGSSKTAFSDPFNIVITNSIARKYFGDEDPLGKIINIEGNAATVSGVLEDIPHNSHIQFDFVASFKLIYIVGSYGSHWGAFNFVTYVQLLKGTNLNEMHLKMTDIGLKNSCPQVENGVCFYLQPLSELHLDYRNNYRSYGDIGDSRLVYSFSIIAFVILLIACINFINLSTARSSIRAKEVGMRKTVGANRIQIIIQFLSESIMLALISLIAAIVIMELFLPFFNHLSGKQLTINYTDYRILSGFFVFIIVTGLLAGSFPALYLSAFHPVKVLKGVTSFRMKGVHLRKILVIIQFSLSTVLIIGTLIIYQQRDYIRTMNLGFDKESIIYIPAKGQIGEKYQTVKAELLQDPGIFSVTAQNYLLAATCNRTTAYDWEGKDPDHQQDMIISRVDFNFFETLNMKLLSGRTFSESNLSDTKEAFILNEEAIRQMGIESPVGKRFTYYKKPGTIIGVVKDTHLRSLHHKIEPHVFHILEDVSSASDYGVVLIKYNGLNTSQVITAIETVWKDLNPKIPFEYHFLDETYDNLYKVSQKLGLILGNFTILAIFVSCLGLFGLISFIAERRTKEIGIRKVLGATINGIVGLLSKEFLILIIIANLIAWPIAYYIMNKLLQNYAYHISIGPGVFIFSAAVALAISLITISYKALKTALADPVDALRYE